MKINFKDQFSLRNDQADVEEIRCRIESGSKVNGTNMYILIFAILIACIGLNMNSTAIVIGAMLISPLMGTIISIAYGFANRDLKWVKKSFEAFAFQIGIAILSSTIYFLFSPINTFSGELAARTNPSIWDVLIAVLGGCAAVIANTRKTYFGNVIAGTAIATALMPPLCTIGYCIASKKWIPALGAAYLFTINATFICLTSLAGLHIMKVTDKKQILSTLKSKLILTTLLLVMIIPSFFLAWQTVKESSIQKNFNLFLQNEFNFVNSQIVTSDIDIINKTINISLIGSTVSNDEIDIIKNSLAGYNLGEYKLEIIQTYVENGITADEIKQIFDDSDISIENSSIKEKLEEAKLLLNVRQEEDKIKSDLSKELCIVYPEIDYAGFTTMRNKDEEVFTLVLMVNKDIDADTKTGISDLIKYKLDKDIDILYILNNKKESVQ